jgi:hypothetical protein
MISRIKSIYLKWRDKQDLKDIQKLVNRVFRNEPIGGVVELNGKEYVVEDIQLSMRRGQIISRRTLFRAHATKRQRSAMRKLMIQQLQKSHTIDG